MRIEELALYVLVFILSQVVIKKNQRVQEFLQKKTLFVVSCCLLGLVTLLAIGSFLPFLGLVIPFGTIFIFSVIYKRYFILFEHNEKRFV
ncbi:hypothetical protein ACFP65_09765 [Marinilactibacillus sp. GCM10026970]|uniref:hypothetical protein n=1 Tax=Marinilactibacillus sp. GCM10026970 TaxID=3252642 RepID=UPI003613A474